MQKKEIRANYLQKRAQFSEATISAQSRLIGLHLIQLLASKPPIRFLHTFLPARQKGEVDTLRVLEAVQPEFPHLQVLVPKVREGTRQLSHYLLHPGTRLIDNKWGIPEPSDGLLIPPDQADLILIPMLACDWSGNRVGYGGGFYDVFLAQCRPDASKVGLSFFDPVDRIDDVEPHDIRLDLCITPARILDFSVGRPVGF